LMMNDAINLLKCSTDITNFFTQLRFLSFFVLLFCCCLFCFYNS
jgi:hypothetical protein